MVDPEILQRIQRLRAEGASPDTIAAALNSEGLVTAAGKRWHRHSVAEVLWRAQSAHTDPGRVGERRSPDVTTELQDRNGLLELSARLIGKCAPHGSLAMFVMEVRHFRHVNSALGDLGGDAVLSEMGERLRHLGAPGDVVARIGDNAFALLTCLPSAAHDEVERAVTRVQHSMGAPYAAATGASIVVAMTIGVASGTSVESASVLLHNAELAMYRAETGHRPWALYDAELDEPAARALADAAELRAAMAAGELVVHYQPVVDLRTGIAHSVEALVRWEHPERGLVPPGDFLPLAETFDLMGELTEVVVGQVADQLRRWAAAGRSLPCSVNLTATCLSDLRHSGRIVAALSGLAGAVTVEVVESVMADDDAIRTLLRLADAGVPCAIDDFGTGYSSMGSLKRLPATTVKIDRSLLEDIEIDPRDVDVVRAIVRLARSFDLEVIAEGVETEQAAARLREAGVHLAQGFWLGRPMSAELLEQWFDAPPRVAAPATPLSAVALSPGDHRVLLHGCDDELTGEVADFLAPGLAGRGHVIAVVSAARKRSLLAALPQGARRLAEREGRLLVLDARETLSLFMRDGAPDPELFETRIARVVRERLARSTGVWAYGEMTTMLWQEGNLGGALALEELWQELQRDIDFSLLCAYPLVDLQGHDGAQLGRLCHAHSSVLVRGSAEQSAKDSADGAESVTVLLDSTRALLRVEAAEQAVGVLMDTVTALGGSTVPAARGSAEALPIDISLGLADPVLPTALLDSRAHALLSSLLPSLVEDARVAARRVERLSSLSEEADTDPLTGLSNRRGLRTARRLVDTDCVVMLDLDLFKEVNDTHGHDAGDRLLVAFSRAARQHLRSTDLVFRLGGDEFLIVLPGTTEQGAEKAIRELRRHWEDERPFPTTFSAGIAQVVGGDLDASMHAADVALYRAKQAGRDVIGSTAAPV